MRKLPGTQAKVWHTWACMSLPKTSSDQRVPRQPCKEEKVNLYLELRMLIIKLKLRNYRTLATKQLTEYASCQTNFSSPHKHWYTRNNKIADHI